MSSRGTRKPFFIDTADPSKRSEEHIFRFCEMLPRLAEKFEVYLGFNLGESAFIARAVGLTAPPNTLQEVLTYSKRLRERLGIDAVVIHWSRHAVGNDLNSAACASSFHESSRITQSKANLSPFPFLRTRVCFIIEQICWKSTDSRIRPTPGANSRKWPKKFRTVSTN
jgi:hypothetical protein